MFWDLSFVVVFVGYGVSFGIVICFWRFCIVFDASGMYVIDDIADFGCF